MNKWQEKYGGEVGPEGMAPGQSVTFTCGCVVKRDEATGVLRSTSKCEGHLAEAGKGGLAHYVEMGCIKDGVPQHKRYGMELMSSILDLPYGADMPNQALEIGCGLAMYYPLLRDLGLSYHGVEPDVAAAAWVESTFDIPITTVPFPECLTHALLKDKQFVLILAAHVLEHMGDPFTSLRAMYDALLPHGVLVVVVPNDDDPVNPDHLWFFDQATLRRAVEGAGFSDIRMVEKQVVQHEKFIYLTAVKP